MHGESAVTDVAGQKGESRVLLLAATGQDAEAPNEILLHAGIPARACRDGADLCSQLTAGAGAVLMFEEALDGCRAALADWLQQQPAWSDLPVLVVARGPADSAGLAAAVQALGNVTVLERAAGAAALLSAVHTALRARERQYDLRDQIARHEQVVEELGMALAATDAGSWQLDLTSGDFSASDRAVAMHGLPPGTPLTHALALGCVHPDDRAGVDTALRRTIDTGLPLQHEHRVLQPDGSVRWVVARAERRGGAGRPRILGLVQDITDRKRTEAERQDAQEQVAATLESITDGFARFDADWRVVYVNAETERLVQMTRAEMIGRTHWELFPATVGTQVETEYRRAVAERTAIDLEVEFEPLHGWFGIRGYPTPDGGLTVYFQNITARKRAEEQQRRLTAALDSLIASAPLGIVLFDADMRFQHINAVLAAMNGLPVEAHIGKTVAEVVPALHDAAQALFQRVMDSGEPVHQALLEGETPKAPGSQRVWRETWFPVLGADGRPEGVGVIVEDITAQQRAAEQLRDASERLTLATQAAALGIHTYDVKTGQIEWDERVRALWGVPADEPIRYETFLAGLHADDVAPTQAALDKALDAAGDGIFAVDYRVRNRQDGAVRWVAATGMVFFEDGQAVRLVGTVQDISERKQAEVVLRASEDRLSGILRQSPVGIVQTDAAGCMTLVNPCWCDMLGYTDEELLGRSILDITHSSSVAPTAAAFGRLAAGGPNFRIEKAYSRKDGSVLRAQSSVAALRSPAGAFLGLLAVVVDISERLRNEEDLREMAARLSEAARAKDVFLATLGHELRNPLAPLRNGLKLMKVKHHDSEAVDDLRAMMDRQVEQIVRLVDDLLDVSRITQGKVTLRKERVSLSAVIDAALETSRPTIEQAGHELSVAVPQEPVVVDGDATRLAQVVANLLHNASKYTHRGGHVRLTVRREEATAVVSVQDNGIGIPTDMLGRVFEMFTQVDRTLEKTTGGLGIGLSLVKGLVELHGGTIEARSDGEGLGSEFVVRLPAATAPVAALQQPQSQGSETLPSVHSRILVVDDNADAADSLAHLLVVLGHEVRTAGNGEDAIAVAAKYRPDLVLMDIGMPRLNGYEAARRMRQQPWCQRAVLVALTGWGQEDDRRKSMDAGFDQHLVKPVQMDTLTQLLSGLDR